MYVLFYYCIVLDCPVDDTSCVPKDQSQIDTDQGLINGLFGTGAGKKGKTISVFINEKALDHTMS